MIKFNITDELENKFYELIKSTLNTNIRYANIKDLGDQYRFEFSYSNGDVWHFELDKNSFEGGNHFILHCSTIKMNIPMDYIKDLKMFCAQIARIKEMQIEYVKNR